MHLYYKVSIISFGHAIFPKLLLLFHFHFIILHFILCVSVKLRKLGVVDASRKHMSTWKEMNHCWLMTLGAF
jgi:hypothetical protein